MEEMFECTKCHVSKNRVEFWARNDRKGKGIHSKCKRCCSEAYAIWRKSNLAKRQRDLQVWRQNNPERIRKLYRDSDQRRRNSTQDWVNQLKARPCKDCDQSFEPYVMDFDHRDPSTKRFVIGFMVSKRMPREAIEQEIAKCDLVCANCHRKRTFTRKP